MDIVSKTFQDDRENLYTVSSGNVIFEIEVCFVFYYQFHSFFNLNYCKNLKK